jgi:hypothetical protein
VSSAIVEIERIGTLVEVSFGMADVAIEGGGNKNLHDKLKW